MDIFKALRLAIRAETNAQKMYTRLAAEASDAEVKALFGYLEEFEIMHQRFLEAEQLAWAATNGEKQGKPSHWLKLLKEKLQLPVDGTAGTEMEQARLSLAAAESIAKILRNANEELSQKQSYYEQELAIAADIQSKLLPQELPQNTGLQIAAANLMARSVGGDYYDFVTNHHGQLSLVVADSMGKGIPASLLMTTVRALWRSFSVSADSSPGQMLETINQAVYPDLEANAAFVTMFCAVYDQVTALFRYSNAGHNPPILRPKEFVECRELDIGNTPVGIFPDTSFPSGEFLMQEGDVIVIYTDGVVEAEDASGELFGYEKLCTLVEQKHESDAETIKNAILSEVESHTSSSPQTDDITVMVLKKN